MYKNRLHLLNLAALALMAVLMGSLAAADVIQPVNLQMKETDEGTVLVQWKVPIQVPIQATPRPVLPDHCVSKGDQDMVDQPGGRLFTETFRCEGGLGGEAVGILYPFYNATLSTLVRVELQSGEQFVHVLAPGEGIWTLPEGSSSLKQDPWTHLKRPVVAGGDHFLGSWIHWALALAICLFGGSVAAVRLATAFAAGQIVSVALISWFGFALEPALAETGVLLTVVFLAAQSLRPPLERGRTLALAAAGGLVHGLGLTLIAPPPPSFGEIEWLYLALVVLGMDALLVVAGVAISVIGSAMARLSWSGVAAKAVSYGLGGVGIAAALSLVLMSPAEEAEAIPASVGLPSLSLGPGSGGNASTPGSRALAPQGLDAPVQTFLTIEPFETRVETLVRLKDVAARIDLTSEGLLEIEDQTEVKTAIVGLITPAMELAMDGAAIEPVVEQIDFLEVGSQGVLPRSDPIPEEISRANVGLTLSYLTSKTPDEIRLRWSGFDDVVESVPSTVTDPESTRSTFLTVDQPELVWVNELVEDPVPTVESVAVKPKSYAIPMFAVPLFVLSIYLIVSGMRGRLRTMKIAWSRVSLAAALLVAPNGRLTVDLEASTSSVPSTEQAKSILVALLPNVYRAFEFRDESAVYDRLAINVTGDTLADIYLEHRRALEVEERGGARARVEAVEVPEVRSVEPLGEGAFDAEATWLVGGTVSHFGHRHFRQNRYDARISLVPVDGVWKINAIEIFDEERLK